MKERRFFFAMLNVNLSLTFNKKRRLAITEKWKNYEAARKYSYSKTSKKTFLLVNRKLPLTCKLGHTSLFKNSRLLTLQLT